MEAQLKWIVLSCLSIATVVQGFSSGPPPATCSSMTPGHGAPSQDLDESPYMVSLSSETYSPGRRITVSVTGGDFKGIQCQIRNDDSEAVGKFVEIDESGFKTLDCFDGDDSAIIHSSGDEKDDEEFTWMAPCKDEGDLKARCTIVQSFSTYWVGLESNSLTFLNDTMCDPSMTSGESGEDEDGDLTAIIVGIVAAVVAVVTAVAAGIFWFFRM